jgi:hypothetical protein
MRANGKPLADASGHYDAPACSFVKPGTEGFGTFPVGMQPGLGSEMIRRVSIWGIGVAAKVDHNGARQNQEVVLAVRDVCSPTVHRIRLSGCITTSSPARLWIGADYPSRTRGAGFGNGKNNTAGGRSQAAYESSSISVTVM